MGFKIVEIDHPSLLFSLLSYVILYIYAPRDIRVERVPNTDHGPRAPTGIGQWASSRLQRLSLQSSSLTMCSRSLIIAAAVAITLHAAETAAHSTASCLTDHGLIIGSDLPRRYDRMQSFSILEYIDGDEPPFLSIKTEEAGSSPLPRYTARGRRC